MWTSLVEQTTSIDNAQTQDSGKVTEDAVIPQTRLCEEAWDNDRFPEDGSYFGQTRIGGGMGEYFDQDRGLVG